MNPASATSWRLQVHEVLPSTSDLCRDLANNGEPHGLAVLAHRQSEGRGSRGRAWSSPPGNLALSVLLRPNLPPREAAQMSLLAGVALAEATQSFAPNAPLALKWPNDLLLAQAKLAGILIETHGADGTLDWLIIGIGVNLAHAPAIPGRATAALAQHAPAPTPDAFATVLLARLDHWLQTQAQHGFGPIRSAWLRHAQPLGSAMSIKLGDQIISGHFAGLGDDGSLHLQTPAGPRHFTAGDVLFPLEA